MKTVSIEIPAPDFSFEEIAKDKAKGIVRFQLHGGSLNQYIGGINPGLVSRVETEIYTLYNAKERLLCIAELLTFLTDAVIKYNNNPFDGQSEEDKLKYSKGIDKLKYALYSIASTASGYTFDKNAFTYDEVGDLNQKIDAILSSLETVKMGQEVLGDMVEELTDEFNSLKSSYVLGKKTWKQKATGIVVSFVGKKGSDAIWDVIKPYMKDFFVNHSPELVHKLLSQHILPLN
jgi:hypothetical protein